MAKRKRIFLNAIKVFHGMSGQKIRIGNQTFDAPFQGIVDSNKNRNFAISLNGLFNGSGAGFTDQNYSLAQFIMPTNASLKKISFDATFSDVGAPTVNLLGYLGFQNPSLAYLLSGVPNMVLVSGVTYSQRIILYKSAQQGTLERNFFNGEVNLNSGQSFSLSGVVTNPSGFPATGIISINCSLHFESN